MDPNIQNPPVAQDPLPPPPPANAPSTNNHFLLALVIVLTISLIGFISYYLGTKNQIADKEKSSAMSTLTSVPASPSLELGASQPPTITISSPSSGVSPTLNPDSNSFISTKLGLSFRYAKLMDSTTKINVAEMGNKIYVAPAGTKIETGQSVEVFSKSPTDTLSQAIKKQLLSAIPETDCFVKLLTDKKLPANFSKATISYPVPTGSSDPAFTFGTKCPENYKESNGVSYFLADARHPSKFLFFSIGQYLIPEATNGNTGWQDTIAFLD